ncbi:MAG: aminotransferase class V-fold PLP-dependent enzyme, partial [bacterium]
MDFNPQLLPADLLERARALFPHIIRDKIYLNHAATAPLSTRVVDAMMAHFQERSSGSIDSYWTDLPKKEECRAFVQRLINAESPDRIAFAANTSDAINIIASGMPWQSGDRVLLNDMEFPANVYPYLHLRRLGVEIDHIRCASGKITPEMIKAALTPRTRIVALSAVQFLSGYRADMAAIGELCRRRGIFFVVDGIQAVGAIHIDVQ